MKSFLLSVGFIGITASASAQDWVEMMRDDHANFYKIQENFYKFFSDKDLTVKSTGYKAFKRWEYIVEPRVYPSGDLSVMNQTAKNYTDFLLKYNLNNNQNKSMAASATWTAMGPMGAPTGLVGGLPRKAGRDNFLSFHPSSPNTIFAGTPSGGMWMTTNGGTSWTTSTDNLPVSGCSDLVVDPSNNNIVYLATGDGDGSGSITPNPSDGVYKSTDGGATWTITSLTFPQSSNRSIRRLLIDPTNPQILLCGTNSGIYRTTNAASTWSLVSTVTCWDLEFKPGDPNTVYASGTAFYRSTNGGVNFSLVSTGIPTSGSNRMQIAVTPTNPTNVYVLASKSSDSQFMGVYMSTDNGSTFTTQSTTPNIIGDSCGGTSTGQGQGWYDLAIAASPTTPGEIVVGGVNIWRSTNNGTNWTNIGCWNSPTSLYVHADIHDLEYTPTGTLYTANDGGIYYYTGSSWTDITAQRNIAQIYKLGLSALTPSLWITGHQDNGTNIRNGANYVASLAGDGMDCFIDRTNDNVMYAEQYNGNIYRSTNGGTSWASISAGLTGTGAWVTPWKQDPVAANTIYCGRNQLFKSTNQGTSWTQLGTTGGAGSMVEFAIAPSNNQVIYTLYSASIRKTTNGGTTWSNATGNVSGGSLTFLTIDPNDENHVWVTISGYSATNKVYETIDGGTTWLNITANLPNIPANCSVYEPGSNDRIYIGMDVGVYYKDNSSSTWTLYNNGLPNTPVYDMETTPAAPGKLFAATFGRGVYAVDFVPVSSAPVATYTYYSAACVGAGKIFYDNSSNNPSSWSWSVTPSAGVTFNSAAQNPTVNFTTPGTYTVAMMSGNSFGNSSVYSQTITVSTTPTLVLSQTSATVCQGDPLVMSATGALTYTWSNGGGTAQTATYVPSINWTYTLTGSNSGCISKATFTVTVDPCVGIIKLSNETVDLKVYPNPANDRITVSIAATKSHDVTLEVVDINGKLITKQKVNYNKDRTEHKIDLSHYPAGNYFVKIISKDAELKTVKFIKE